MGKKVRPRGATIASAYLNETAPEPAETEFRKRVVDGMAIGKWLSEWGQPERLPIARRLARAARFLEQLARHLAGTQTGLRNPKILNLLWWPGTRFL